MANATVEHYAAAIVIVGRHILLVRELGSDDFPITGYHFPGGRAKSEDDLKGALAESLKKKYEAKVKILEPVSPLARIQGGRKVVIHGFICEPLSPFKFPAKHFQSVYSSFEGISSLYLDPLDKKLAEKVARFYPIYGYKKRLLALSEKEKGEANFYLDALLYFRSAVPAKEISDFSLLIRSDSTIAQIRSAFYWLLDLYGLDLNQYLDVLEYKKAHPQK